MDICRLILEQNPNNNFALSKLRMMKEKKTTDLIQTETFVKASESMGKNDRSFLFIVIGIGTILLILIGAFWGLFGTHKAQKGPIKLYSVYQVTKSGGYSPCWSSDGSKLAYLYKGGIWALEIANHDFQKILMQVFDTLSTDIDWSEYHLTWSPCGRYMAIGNAVQTIIYDLWTKIVIFATPYPREESSYGIIRFKNSWVSWRPKNNDLIFTDENGIYLRLTDKRIIQLRDSPKDRFPVFLTDSNSIILSTEVTYLGENRYLTTDPIYGIMRLELKNNRVAKVNVIKRNKEDNILGMSCSSDGNYIAYTANEGGFNNLWVIKNDGSNQLKLNRLEDGFIKSYPAWSPSDDGIAVAMEIMGSTNIWIYSLIPNGGKKNDN